MMKKTALFFCSILFCSYLWAGDHKSDSARVQQLLVAIKEKYVPDTREAVFNISAKTRQDTVFVTGSTSHKQAHKALIDGISKIGKFTINDKVRLLPDKKLGEYVYGIVNVSVADIRTQNKFTAGMATQALLGTPVKLLEKDVWYRIQLPDTYLGWAHEKQIVPLNKKEYNKWTMAPKVIFTHHYGFAYSEANTASPIVSDLVAGNLLLFIAIEGDYFKVEYPDKREAYILRKESQEYAIWLQSRKPSADSFIEVAKSMTGIPYVWGGTSTKGMDCSGLVSMVMQLHGLSILRDASQQANVGEAVDISNGYNMLQVGDLMFFGTKNNIRHVGFYLGNKKFLHASGWTRISSLDANDKDYDELNTKEFIKATRVLDNKGLHGVQKIKDNPFYHIQN